MEAIGRLAGGVAHDFNNLLTAIIGYTDMIEERGDVDPSTTREVREIRRAADRGAALTRQLLAFSRKQFLNPTVININESVAGLLHMLPRLIGDHIHTDARLGTSLGFVKADASQIEQVIVNLVLNARDAMPGGGHITIETANATLDEEWLAAEGPETLLLVEDNDAIREISARALRRRGYTVHEARNAEEAIEWAATSPRRAEMLITDVVMPGLSGPNLAARLMQQNPKLRVLYMSGYTDDATEVHGTFWGGVPILQKPFTPSQLAERVRMALDERPA